MLLFHTVPRPSLDRVWAGGCDPSIGREWRPLESQHEAEHNQQARTVNDPLLCIVYEQSRTIQSKRWCSFQELNSSHHGVFFALLCWLLLNRSGGELTAIVSGA